MDHIYEQAKGKDIALVKEGSVFFLVLNKPDNNFDFDSMKAISSHICVVERAIHECLDQVEASTGAACLVTIG